jgi:uncharacterized protein (DUF2461 family)
MYWKMRGNALPAVVVSLNENTLYQEKNSSCPRRTLRASEKVFESDVVAAHRSFTFQKVFEMEAAIVQNPRSELRLRHTHRLTHLGCQYLGLGLG